MSTHDEFVLEIRAVPAGSSGARQILDLLNDPIAEDTALLAPSGREVPVPEGSIKEYLRNHLVELGGLAGYVQLYLRAVNPPSDLPRFEFTAPGQGGGSLSEEEIRRVLPEELKKRSLPLTITVQPKVPPGGTTLDNP